ncbi:MAG TPA: outer membrane beta-barrel protein [Devosiaceae bacterium]|jgi:outer membrane immunogenic protein
MHKLVLAAAAAALFSTSAFAADLSAPSVVVSSSATNWSGFYAGVFGGVATGDFDYSAVPAGGGPSVLDLNVNGGGGLAGVQVGADAQFDQFVVGAVADLALTNHRAEIGVSVPGGGLDADIQSQLNYLGTVRVRAGMAFDNVLAYVHGGLAYGQTEPSISVAGIGAVPGLDKQNRWGYTLGAGIEYKVNDNVSLETEYAYTHFDDKSLADLGAGSINEALSFHTVKAGVNFRF